jgi:membrane associated rhomboid family serine protease
MYNHQPLTTKLLWTCLVSLAVSALPAGFVQVMVLWPLRVADGGSVLAMLGDFRPWQLATHLLVNSIWNLVFVALTLFYFAAQLETWWGRRRFASFLVTCALGAAVLQLIVSSAVVAVGLDAYRPIAGASGLMYAVLFAVAYIAPRQEVALLLPPVRMQMQTLVIVFTVIAVVFGIRESGLWSQVGLVGGMGIAWLHIRWSRGEPPFKPRSKPKPRHLRVV